MKPRKPGQIRNPLLRTRLRQLALFMGMLLSGGLLVIPREPLLVVVLLVSFALVSPAKWFRREFAAIYLVLIATVAVALIGGQSFQIQAFIVRYANFIGGIALLAMYFGEGRQTLANDLFPILKLMCIQAVLTPFVALAVPGLFTTFESGELTYQTFAYVFTYHDTILNAPPIKRPDGFFFEPGVFQFYLNIFLFIALFVRKQSVFNIALGTFAVISTQSTTGAIILVLQYGFAYLHWLKTSNRKLKAAIFLFGPLIIMPIGGYMTYNVVDKFTGQFSGSADARDYDLRTGLAVVAERPVTGIGFDEQRYYDFAARVGYTEVALSKENITERGNTNGIVSLLFNLGVPMALVFLFGLARQRMFAPRYLFAAIIFLSLLAESLSLTPFFLMLIFSGLLLAPAAAIGRARVGSPKHRGSAPATQRA